MLNPADAAFLDSLPQHLLRPVAPADVEEPRGRWTGQGGAVAMPRTPEDVAQILRACASARVGVVPRAGGTGQGRDRADDNARQGTVVAGHGRTGQEDGRRIAEPQRQPNSTASTPVKPSQPHDVVHRCACG